MLKAHHNFVRLLSQVTDGLCVAFSWYLAYVLRFEARLPYLPLPPEMVPFRNYLPYTFVLILIWFLSLQISGAYKSWSWEKLTAEIFCIFRATGLAFLTVIAGTYFLAREDYSRLVLLIFLVCVFLTLTLNRVTLRWIMRELRRRGWNQRRVLLLGDETLASGIRSRIEGRTELGLKIQKFLSVSGSIGSFNSVQILAEIEKTVRDQNVDHVVIALRNEDASLLDPILSALIDLNVEIRIVPDISQYSILGFEVEAFDGLPILTLNQSPIVGWNAVVKRITDVAYASLALLVFSPVMLLIGLCVKLTSRGPLFYSQERMGLEGQTFQMFKFRSMSVNAEQSTGAVWAQKDDQRVTWIGSLIRKTSLDELPQLFNVLKGDMSCVGPRPERPVFVEKFRKEIPGYMLRHKVKAGMTGWAQVNGFRGNTSLEGRIEYDLYYITHWSLFMDFRIMVLTIFKGFISPNAY